MSIDPRSIPPSPALPLQEDYPSNLLRMNIYSQYMYIVLYLIMRVVPFVGHPVTDRLIVVLLCVVIRQILSWLMLILTTNFLKKCAKIFPIDYLPVAPIIITKYRQQNGTERMAMSTYDCVRLTIAKLFCLITRDRAVIGVGRRCDLIFQNF